MTDPTTESGKILLEAFTAAPGEPDFAVRLSQTSIIRHAIPKIEAEAVARERVRITEAVCELWDGDAPFDDIAILRIVNPEDTR
ncbi:MAG TPA: hypothetical protein VLM76_13485 [Patescibacteria group bacterium]|nr:hypothetical protein [Patescibacteria group bacterium]